MCYRFLQKMICCSLTIKEFIFCLPMSTLKNTQERLPSLHPQDIRLPRLLATGQGQAVRHRGARGQDIHTWSRWTGRVLKNGYPFKWEKHHPNISPWHLEKSTPDSFTGLKMWFENHGHQRCGPDHQGLPRVGWECQWKKCVGPLSAPRAGISFKHMLLL